MADNLIPVNLWLAGRSYRIRIKPDEESAVRTAVKLADDKITEMRTHYAGKDDQDFIAMCLLMYAADSATEAFNSPYLKSELNDMCMKIDAVVGKEE
ncbi:MAG: cell division protein ZapA [Flavipsychrobacter sp.]|nr:cell division protein ZapA [Flavipsychrobacter sp.]